MSQNYDIDSLSRGFHNAATQLAAWSPRVDKDYVVNEIKAQTVNICTAILVITVVDSFFRGNIPFNLIYVGLISGAFVLRQVAERSLNASILNKVKKTLNFKQ